MEGDAFSFSKTRDDSARETQREGDSGFPSFDGWERSFESRAENVSDHNHGQFPGQRAKRQQVFVPHSLSVFLNRRQLLVRISLAAPQTGKVFSATDDDSTLLAEALQKTPRKTHDFIGRRSRRAASHYL